MSLSTSLETLKTAKTDISVAIEAKGVELAEGDGFADFAVAISKIKPPSNYGLITFTAAVPSAAVIMVS